jgi:hypothetical protein
MSRACRGQRRRLGPVRWPGCRVRLTATWRDGRCGKAAEIGTGPLDGHGTCCGGSASLSAADQETQRRARASHPSQAADAGRFRARRRPASWRRRRTRRTCAMAQAPEPQAEQEGTRVNCAYGLQTQVDSRCVQASQPTRPHATQPRLIITRIFTSSHANMCGDAAASQGSDTGRGKPCFPRIRIRPRRHTGNNTCHI